MFRLFDVVKLKKNQQAPLSGSARNCLPLKGAIATIVEIYTAPTLAFELEFVCGEETFGLLIVSEDDIVLAKEGEFNSVNDFKFETTSRASISYMENKGSKIPLVKERAVAASQKPNLKKVSKTRKTTQKTAQLINSLQSIKDSVEGADEHECCEHKEAAAEHSENNHRFSSVAQILF